jgi:hypothetical protein
VIRWVFVAFAAVALIALVYALGFPNVGAGLTLSGVLLSVIAYVRSGALSPSWLQSTDSISIIDSINFELTKALICATVGMDFVVATLVGIKNGVIPETLMQAALLVTFVHISAIGTGLFLLRFLGGLIFISRR